MQAADRQDVCDTPRHVAGQGRIGAGHAADKVATRRMTGQMDRPVNALGCGVDCRADHLGYL